MPIHPLRGADGTILKNDGYLDQCKEVPFIGLTKREYFAGLAMHGLLANSEWMERYENKRYVMPNYVASSSIQYADELLKQLDQ